MERYINELCENYGTPFYVFHEQEFVDNYHALCTAFREIYDNYIPAYSYKTNYMPYVCKIVKELGGYAEVVSDMEYQLAKRLGYANEHIIYNGPCKGDALEEHLLQGGILNIDNETEARYIAQLATRNMDKTLKVGLRVNFDVGAGYISRFGLELDGDALKETVCLLKKKKNISISGVHCHISRARGLEAWEKRIDSLLHAVGIYLEDMPDYIDIGSGMFGVMDDSLASQFDVHIPSYAEYATVVAGKMQERYGQAEKKPILFSEPGTTLISKYMSLITRVNHVKTIKNRVLATVDASFYNAGETCRFKQLPYYVINNKAGNSMTNKFMNADIMGYTCLEQDCLYSNMRVPIGEGDIIVFGNVGGYSIVSKPPFIQPNCPVIAWNRNNEMVEIKRSEKFDDIFSTFLI